MQSALPTAMQAPELTPLLMEMLKFGVTAFKTGKSMEGLIDETADKFREQAKQAEGQPKPPSPEQQKMEMDIQIEQQKMQMQMQIEQAKMQSAQQQAQMDAQLEQQKISMQMELEKAKQEYQAQENQLKFQLEDQRNQAKAEMDLKLAQMKMMTERNTQLLLAYVNNGAKVEVAQISAGASNGEGLAEQYDFDEDMTKAMAHPLSPISDAISQGNQEMANTLTMLINEMKAQSENANRPKQVIRGEDGKIIGVM